MKKTRFFHSMGLALLVPFLVACENHATAFMVDGNHHAMILIREQPRFWNNTVDQWLILSRLPDCQRRHPYLPGKAGALEIKLYRVGDLIWALHHEGQWYLASTGSCELKPWPDKADDNPPGPYEGRFVWKESPVFEPVSPEERGLR
jgi:hypothetical protein